MSQRYGMQLNALLRLSDRQALGVLEVPLRLPVHSIEHSWSRGHSPSVSRYRDLLGWVFFFFFRLSSRENPLKFPIMRVQASPNS